MVLNVTEHSFLTHLSITCLLMVLIELRNLGSVSSKGDIREGAQHDPESTECGKGARS